MSGSPWQRVAWQKNMATLAKIPPEWILPEAVLEEAAAMRNIMGRFIRKLLNEEEVTITEAPTAQLVGYIRTRQYSAKEVAAAYCKRAAFAHQLVGTWQGDSALDIGLFYLTELLPARDILSRRNTASGEP